MLFPTLGLYILWRNNLDPELSAAICRAYNTWLADYCSYNRKRLHGVALIPLQDPQRKVDELKYAIIFSAVARRKILWDNPLRLYGLNVN